MRLGVLSDTHLRSIAGLPRDILQALSQADIIIHSGDFTSLAVLEGLREIGKVVAVQGNMDTAEIKSVLPEKEILLVNKKRLGIIHGWGSPLGIEKRVREQFDDVDIIVFGHSHQPRNEIIDGVLLFNPGESRNTFGLLEIDNDEIKGQIVPVIY
jgi:putative phosphoesterase